MGTSICAGEASFCGGSPNSGLTLIIAQARLVKPAPPITQQVWEGSEWKSKCEKQSVSLTEVLLYFSGMRFHLIILLFLMELYSIFAIAMSPNTKDLSHIRGPQS